MKNLREALDEYRKEIYHIDRQPAAIFGENDRDDIMRSIGFQDCLDLLFPLVEALEYVITESGTSCNYNHKARQALSDLKAKLGIEFAVVPSSITASEYFSSYKVDENEEDIVMPKSRKDIEGK